MSSNPDLAALPAVRKLAEEQARERFAVEMAMANERTPGSWPTFDEIGETTSRDMIEREARMLSDLTRPASRDALARLVAGKAPLEEEYAASAAAPGSRLCAIHLILFGGTDHPRLNQLLLIAASNELTASGMRDGPWRRAMEAGAAGIRELAGAFPALLAAARERDTLREQNARLVEALEWALGMGTDPQLHRVDGDKAFSMSPEQMDVFAAEERAFAARRVLTAIRPKVARGK